jgi:hypothetical protein
MYATKAKTMTSDAALLVEQPDESELAGSRNAAA